MQQLSYSAGFVRPFVHLLTGYAKVSPRSLEGVRTLTHDQRVSIGDAHASVDYWVSRSGDVDLGLKAGRLSCLGWGGSLEFAMRSAPTVRAATELAARYARLFSDTLRPTLEIEGNRALIRLDNAGEWPRAITDFTLSAWFVHHVRSQLGEAPWLQCWLTHDAPRDTSLYEQTFAPAKIRFNAPCNGFAFDVDFAEAPLASADPTLHALQTAHLQIVHAAVGQARQLTPTVRAMVAKQLPVTRPTAAEIARELRMSRRTLARKLEQEGTTFVAEVAGVRRELALGYVTRRDLPFAQIAALLGFSNVQAFHRAFKRGTGHTPGQYRASALGRAALSNVS